MAFLLVMLGVGTAQAPDRELQAAQSESLRREVAQEYGFDAVRLRAADALVASGDPQADVYPGLSRASNKSRTDGESLTVGAWTGGPNVWFKPEYLIGFAGAGNDWIVTVSFLLPTRTAFDAALGALRDGGYDHLKDYLSRHAKLYQYNLDGYKMIDAVGELDNAGRLHVTRNGVAGTIGLIRGSNPPKLVLTFPGDPQHPVIVPAALGIVPPGIPPIAAPLPAPPPPGPNPPQITETDADGKNLYDHVVVEDGISHAVSAWLSRHDVSSIVFAIDRHVISTIGYHGQEIEFGTMHNPNHGGALERFLGFKSSSGSEIRFTFDTEESYDQALAQLPGGVNWLVSYLNDGVLHHQWGVHLALRRPTANGPDAFIPPDQR
jgi:hypothetical protein